MTEIHTGQAPAPVTREQLQERLNVRFFDPALDAERNAIARREAIAWDALQEGAKASEALSRRRPHLPAHGEVTFSCPQIIPIASAQFFQCTRSRLALAF